MARFSRTIRIDALPTEVWATLIDLQAWPTWASQFAEITPTDVGPLRVGSHVRIRPKAMPTANWEVTEHEDGRRFTWAASLVPGLRIVGGHELESVSDSTDATFWLEAQGPVGALLSPVLRRTLFSRNTRNATQGLKRRVEERLGAAVSGSDPP